MSRVGNKIALITGGASGIGAETARLFCEEGAQVVIADIDESAAAALAAELGPAASACRLDVTDEASWQQAMTQVRDQHGRLDILVNNAGVSIPSTIEEATLEHWHQVQAINSDSVFLGCKHGLHLMKETTRAGCIVNLSSTLATRPQAPYTAYNASKASVWATTRTVALHCCEQGYPIRCNSVHPGATHTPMMQAYLDAAEDPEEMMAMFAANHPMNRVGQPRELALAILFLASDEASFITGVALPVDGGFCAA